jgi:ubiquinone/menaquinone biosynthesis C-methylase UbiE
MNRVDFSKITAKYEDFSLVQKSAAEKLLNLLEIGNTDDVLDLGCGVGNLTREIRKTIKGKVFGIDRTRQNNPILKEAIECDKTF